MCFLAYRRPAGKQLSCRGYGSPLAIAGTKFSSFTLLKSSLARFHKIVIHGELQSMTCQIYGYKFQEVATGCNFWSIVSEEWSKRLLGTRLNLENSATPQMALALPCREFAPHRSVGTRVHSKWRNSLGLLTFHRSASTQADEAMKNLKPVLFAKSASSLEISEHLPVDSSNCKSWTKSMSPGIQAWTRNQNYLYIPNWKPSWTLGLFFAGWCYAIIILDFRRFSLLCHLI